ncbi:MAG: hypothetical protein ABIL39_10755 [candidate division WOR-3 bacterium]
MPFTEDRGIDIRLHTGLNLAGASIAQAKVKKPDNSTTTWTMTIYDEENGVLQYITSTTDNELSLAGTWQIQAKVTFVTGEVYHGSIGSFDVYNVLF